MKTLGLFFSLLICILPTLAFGGTAYYVDPTVGDGGDGSYSSPWNNISDINGHSFSSGDDVYFKINTTCTADAKLTIDWSGTSGDRVVIGAYYGEGQFGLNGNTRPVIDANFNYPSLSSGGLIENTSSGSNGYITIQDLRLEESNWAGITSAYADYMTVDNCYIYRSKARGIGLFRCVGGIVSDNIVEQASYNNSPGAGIEISAMDSEGSTTNCTISGNTVFHTFEGIGIYNGCTNITVEKNVVYDCRSYMLYTDSGTGITVRYNLVYGSSDASTWSGGHSEYAPSGIIFNVENQGTVRIAGDCKIYGNLVANCYSGIGLADGDPSIYYTNMLIYNNTLVDNVNNFRFGDNIGWSGNRIENNISLTTISGRHHVYQDNYSRSGITWDNNNFDDPVSGNAANNARIFNPHLIKTSGWNSISPGTARGTEWGLQENSLNRTNGKPIVGYNTRIYDADFTSKKKALVRIETYPSIGAWAETTAVNKPPDSPLGLNITK